MKRFFVFLLVVFSGLGLYSCAPASPEKNFDVAVLNSNVLVGFAGEGMWRELQSPSMKMGKSKDEVLAMQRQEVVDAKIKFAEENLSKLNGLVPTGDAKEIIQTSVALHQYILPVYRNEYTALAKQLDGGASPAAVEKQAQQIHDKYFAGFETLYRQLIANGKRYAQQHNIAVNWAM